MAKILVLYYSMYGHVETMAQAVAEGARRIGGVEVTIKRVPETMPAEVFANAGGKTQDTPVATPQELADCVCGEYDVPPDTALQDVENFLQQLREIGALLEA